MLLFKFIIIHILLLITIGVGVVMPCPPLINIVTFWVNLNFIFTIVVLVSAGLEPIDKDSYTAFWHAFGRDIPPWLENFTSWFFVFLFCFHGWFWLAAISVVQWIFQELYTLKVEKYEESVKQTPPIAFAQPPKDGTGL